MLALLTTFALAATPDTDRASVGIRFGMLAESWDDPALGQVYRTGMLAPTLGAALPLIGPLHLDVCAAYGRVAPRDDGTDARLEMLPLTAALEWLPVRRDFGDVYVGAGPSLIVFSERHPSNTPSTVLRGTRGAVDVRAGVRVDTGLVRPPTLPGLNHGLKRVEIDIAGGRRLVLPRPTGFRLGAWRFQASVVARF